MFIQFNRVMVELKKVVGELHENGIKCGVALFGETLFSLISPHKKQSILQILKKYDGLVISSKIDSFGARLN